MAGEPGGDLVRREEREAVALRLVDLREHPVDAAVDIVHGDDMVAGESRCMSVVAARDRPRTGACPCVALQDARHSWRAVRVGFATRA
jgi:hypothetical protein